MTEYKIAIPSYKRAKTLRDKTLVLLRKYKIPAEKIYIFVANEEEKKKCIKDLPNYYKEIVVCTNSMGIGKTRNFIQDYFDEGIDLFWIDDDVVDVVVKTGGNSDKNENSAEELPDLDLFIKKAFDLCRKHKVNLWGTHPLANPFFLSDKTSLDIRYINASLFGMINTHDKSVYVTMDSKEDFERSILFYIRDRKIMRFNYVGIKTGYYTEKGGMQETRTPESERKSGMALIEKYPMLCEYNKARKNHFEIRLVDKTKRKK